MAGRPAAGAVPPTLRLEVLKELQQLIENRDSRERIDRGPIAEARGREHWVLHLLLRAEELAQAHTDTLIGSVYSNLTSRLATLDDRLNRLEELQTASVGDLRERLDAAATATGEAVDRRLEGGSDKIAKALVAQLAQSLDQKWKPVGESIETFAVGSRQVLKDVADTYRVATQTRLLLNENARRITDLGRDLVALEESLKLVVARTLEEGLGPLEQRVAALENHAGLAAGGAARDPPKPAAPGSPA